MPNIFSTAENIWTAGNDAHIQYTPDDTRFDLINVRNTETKFDYMDHSTYSQRTGTDADHMAAFDQEKIMH